MFLSCVLILSPVVLFSVQTIEACAQENDKDGTTSELYALSAVLMDADNGRILLQKNGTEVLPMASTTKIMTCILALEQANPDDYVSVSSYAAGMPKVHLGVRKGDVFRLGDLLYSLMLESHNDTAAAIAEHVAGTREAFADMMNQKVRGPYECQGGGNRMCRYVLCHPQRTGCHSHLSG